MAAQPKILDGKWLSAQICSHIGAEVAKYQQRVGRAPGLGVILVGDNPASQTYVANKEKTAKKCGFNTFDARLPASSSAKEVLAAIEKFNADPNVDGILLQLPLPAGIDSGPLIESIRPDKDADGLHPVNQGLLMRGAGVLRPCTPLGSMKLIDLAYSPVTPSETSTLGELPQADLAGKSVVVIGRSVLVGKPVGLLALERNATVTMAHSKTKDLPALCRSADILIVAVGIPQLVKGDWVADGAVVIDVGINRLPSGKLVGDVDFESVAPRCSAITPVPGGVGPMTIAMLILNTLRSFKTRHALA
ncbi:MAG: bifunctional methylenetetrahydrofolate dehydrogenase/methenyltetrahydrofolate cyclohydrolase FolD [Deltaproteobacteria bacterium]|nr:bifunctional methylenetetrahydrofolate dehydrogenase/methenyltetrahydrofolate cyclohydrolase FolD [Deltaproteobacteria bacterium]